MSCFANRHYNYTCQISIKMKASNIKKFKLLIGLIIISFISLAQSPESMNYQAVIRNSSGTIIANQSIGIRIKILQGSANGSTVYNETFTPTSNAYGMVSLQIGTGSVVSGSFSSIDWGNNSYYVETAADVLGGSNYSVISTTQFMSVPYALYAKTSGSNYVDNSNNISIGSNNPSNFTFSSGNNINLGPQTGQEIYSGANNFYAGPAAGRYQEGVSNNIAIGLEALRGGNNTGQGRSNNSIALGNSAGVLSQGDQNIFIGKSSGYVTTSSNGRNIAIGADALNSGNHHNPYTGDNLICIGDNTQPSSLSASNEITLGDDNISSFRIPGIQSGKSSGDVLTFDGSKLILQTPSSSGSSSSPISVSHGIQEFTTTSSWVVPENIYSVYVKLVGAGGGGGSSSGSSGCQWGGDGCGAGGLIYGYIDVNPLSTLDIFIGSGGVAGSNYSNGLPGEETRIEVSTGNILAQAYGGGGGMGGNSSASSPGSGGSGLFSAGSGIIKSGDNGGIGSYRNSGGSGGIGGNVSSIFYEYPNLGIGGTGSGCPNGSPTNGSAGYVFIEW